MKRNEVSMMKSIAHRKKILKIAQIREKHIKYNNIFHRGSDRAYGATHASGERENISFRVRRSSGLMFSNEHLKFISIDRDAFV